MVRQCQCQPRTLRAGLDVRLELGAELLDRVLDRPAGTVRQAADGGPRNDADAMADVRQDVEVLAPPLAVAHALQDLQHPARPLAAGRTLSARLMREEASDVVADIDDARILVED